MTASRVSALGLVADLAIVGAGILGTATAMAAAAAGLSVVVIDRLGRPGHGSTSSSAGIIRVHAEDYASCALAEESLNAWREWRQFAKVPATEPAAEFVQCGTLILDGSAPFGERIVQVMDEAATEYYLLDEGQVAESWPEISLARFGGPFRIDDAAFWGPAKGTLGRSILTPSSGYVGDPMLAAVNLAAQAERSRARFLMGESVIAVERVGGRVRGLALASGTHITADAVLNAGGPASRHINALAGVGDDFVVHTTPVREELHYLPLPAEMSIVRSGLHLVDPDLGTNSRTDGHGLLVGSNGAACDPLEVLDDPDVFADSPTRGRWEQSALRVAKRIPSLPVPRQVLGVAGVYDVSDDWLPIYDRTALDGFFVAMGTSGNQFKTAPIVGSLLAGLITRYLNGIDQDVNPYQFEMPFSGRVIDTAAFSRLRHPSTVGSRG